MGQAALRKSASKKYVQQWTPPPAWTAIGGGRWQPSDYKPTRWELAQPEVHTPEQAHAEYIKCKKSIAYFAFRYCWTLDTDDPNGISIRKFPAYPYLRRFFDSVQEPTNTLSEKSRQMLMSWAWMIVFTHDLLFQKNYAGLVMSKRAKDVDDGGAESSPNTSLGKIRFIIERLPEHLWKACIYKKFRIACPDMDSYITGETGKGGKVSRGPTYKRALMDEAAFIEQSETVFSGLRQAAKSGTSLNSTPYGMGNTFSRIRHKETTTFQILSFHWSEHPRKSVGLYCLCGWKAQPGNGLTPREQFLQHSPVCPRTRLDPPRSPVMRSPWYDREASDMTTEQIARELDISYEGSREGRVYTGFDQMRNVWSVYHRLGPRKEDETEDEYRERYLRLVIDPNLIPFTCWDIAVGQPCAVLFGQILNDDVPRVRFLDEVQTNDKSYDFYANIVNTVWKQACAFKGNQIPMKHYGGLDFKQRDSKLESWFTNLKAERIYVETHGKGELLEWCDYINDQGYRRGNIEISEWCKGLIDAVNNYHYPRDKDTGEPLPGKQLPVHDQWSHRNDAKRYLFKVRYQEKLYDRARRGVRPAKVLARGRQGDRSRTAYDPRTETRKF